MNIVYRFKRPQPMTAPKAPSRQTVRARIVKALNNPAYKFRTLSSVAEEAGLSATVVAQLLRDDKVLARTVKLVPIRAPDGRVLLTTKDRFANEATFKEKFVDFFASDRPRLADA